MKKKNASSKQVPSLALETYGGHYQRFESTFRPRTMTSLPARLENPLGLLVIRIQAREGKFAIFGDPQSTLIEEQASQIERVLGARNGKSKERKIVLGNAHCKLHLAASEVLSIRREKSRKPPTDCFAVEAAARNM